MSDENPLPELRPLSDVWLRPRRVFRSLAAAPVGPVDYLLASAQGMVSWLALCRAQDAGQHSGIAELIGKGLVAGPIAGVLGILLMTALYTRVGRGAGGTARRAQVFHVLAYGGVPLLASLGLWLLTALLVGPATFMKKTPADLDAVPALLLTVQSAAHFAAIAWSLLLQVMGFSEVGGLPTRRALGVWLVGQLLAVLAVIMLAIVVFGPDFVPPA